MSGMKTPGFLTGGLALVSVFALSVTAGDFKHIAIDGSFDDWAGVRPAFEDLSDTTNSIDYAAVYVANDADYLYLRFTLHARATPSRRARIFSSTLTMIRLRVPSDWRDRI